MKKTPAFAGIAVALIAGFIPAASATTVVANGKCARIGQTATVGGKKFTCIKSGKKLLWNRGVALSPVPNMPTPTPTPAPTAATPVKVFIPIALPVTQAGPITFANAESKFADIPQIAWQNIQNGIAVNPAVNIPTDLFIGPNTDTTQAHVLSFLQKEYRLWSGFQQPSAFGGLIFNAKDEPWAEAEWPKLAAQFNLTERPADFIPNHLRPSCAFNNGVATECYGGMAVIFQGKTSGWAFYGVQSPFWSPESTMRGPISQVTHEYTHNVQFAQWIGLPLKPGENLLADATHHAIPCWFSEGQANGIGVPVVSASLAQYNEARENSIRRSISQNGNRKPSLSDSTLTATNIANFLYSQDIATCYDPSINPDWQLGYSVGYAATEVLVAIGGPQSTMALVAQTANGLSWADAFQSVYGIAWKDASEVLGKVLAAEYLAKPMNH